MRSGFALAILLSAGLWGCAGPDSIPSPKPSPAPGPTHLAPKEEPKPVTAPRKCEPTRNHGRSWGSATKEDKRTTMECNVMPVMLDLFSRHDAKYAAPGAFHCQTCHGEPGTAGSFDFSKPSHLHPLDPNHMPTEFDADPKIAAAVRFMKYEVMPAMQSFIHGAKVTCFSCHAQKKN